MLFLGYVNYRVEADPIVTAAELLSVAIPSPGLARTKLLPRMSPATPREQRERVVRMSMMRERGRETDCSLFHSERRFPFLIARYRVDTARLGLPASVVLAVLRKNISQEHFRN